MRHSWRAVAANCLCALAVTSASPAAARQQQQQQQPPPPPPAAGGGGQAPSMKRSDKIEVPPARARRSYDPERKATYVNIDITLLARPAPAPVVKAKGKDKDKGRAAAAPALTGREVTMTFQLAYRGVQTYDLIAVYLIVESVAAPEAGDKLTEARRLEVGADPYVYTYERADYKTEAVTLTGAVDASTPPVRRELAAFRVPTEDLPQIANAGRLAIKIGAEEFAVRSAQLTELRRTLVAGVEE